MRYFLILPFLFHFIQSQADFKMNDNMRNAYSHIISLDINNANILLNNEKKINPHNGIIDLYENYIDFLYLLINEDEVLFQDLSRNKLKRIKNIKLNDKSSPYYLYSQAEIYLQWSFISIKFGDYVKGAYEIQIAYFLIKKKYTLKILITHLFLISFLSYSLENLRVEIIFMVDLMICILLEILFQKIKY